jgi:hypothetical protein
MERNVSLEAVEYKGRKAVRLTKEPPGNKLALLPATDFQDGTIEADLAMKPTTPPGFRNAGFTGIAFRARPDGSRHEFFYLRPGTRRRLIRRCGTIRCSIVRSLTSKGTGCVGSGRRSTKPMLTSARSLDTPQARNHGPPPKVYLNGLAKRSLVADGLQGQDLHGVVGLWGYAVEEWLPFA